MGGRQQTRERFGRLADRLAAFAAGHARVPKGFVSQQEPRSVGVYGRGKQLLTGNILFAGHLVQAPDRVLWDVPAPDPAFLAEAHGFAWLDDLVAFGTPAARVRAREWTHDWIARHGSGSGPGWTPDLTGRRIVRWVHHATTLLSGCDRATTDAFYRSLARQSAYLSRRWKAAAPGLPQIEALTGLVYAGLSLMGLERLVAPSATGLASACRASIDLDGGILSRNPEELLEILTLLTWAASAMTEAARPVPAEISAAIRRVTPALRTLRHADGGLARFHGGERGAEGRLDQALAASGIRPGPAPSIAMGYCRLTGRRTTVIVDAAPPPGGSAARGAHASTTGFELTSGRRPLIVNCGPGAGFGAAWANAARATLSHSALCIDGSSSSRFGPDGMTLEHRAAITTSRMTLGSEGADLYLAHDGWLASHGLTVSRSLTLAQDGRRLSGVDTLTAMTVEAQRRFQDLMTATAMSGAGFSIRFHLHPDVHATLDMSDTAVSMALRSGEIWIFRFSGRASLSLEPTAYLEPGRVHPRPAAQIVLRSEARGFETRIGWTLAKAKDTPLAIRDLERTDPDDPD
ncbi:MAG: heparinase [Rhodobacterales bacterium 32-66-7]|nr:MAG: heparinase [Rhodobacterales bacterium 32-66-7]